MSLDIACIEEALQKWVKKELCIESIFAHQNAPRPEDQYALINLVGNTVIGHCESLATAVDPVSPETVRTINLEHSNVWHLMASINVYRGGQKGGAFSQVVKLRDSICKITVKDQMWDDGLAFIETSDVRDIPEVIDKEWEQRAQIDFFFYVRSLDEESINEIKEVELTNEIDGSTTTIP